MRRSIARQQARLVPVKIRPDVSFAPDASRGLAMSHDSADRGGREAARDWAAQRIAHKRNSRTSRLSGGNQMAASRLVIWSQFLGNKRQGPFGSAISSASSRACNAGDEPRIR